MIRIENLTKGYRRNVVINDLTWEVPAGRTVLLGPNGAGKSTLMHCIAGLLKPKRGKISIDGLSFSDRKNYYPKLGWMPQHIHPLPGRSCLDQVAYAGWLKGMSNPAAKVAAVKVIEQVGLEAKVHQSANKLSGGQLRRLGLAEALIGAPTALVLDEPSVGLDPGQRERFRRVLGSLSDVDCLVSTHQVDDIDSVFNNVAVMYSGKIVHTGTVENFLNLAPSGLDTAHATEHAYRLFVPDED